MEAKLERAVADLRADLDRHEGGLVKVFADQLEAVLDALEGKPDLTVQVNPKDVHVSLREVSVVEDPYANYKDYNGLWLLGLTVKLSKPVNVYPSLAVGTFGRIMGYNYGNQYAYRVKFEGYTTVNMSDDEIELG